MKVIIVFAALLCVVYAAKVSENCLWGRTSASKCCKNIPNGDSTHLADPSDCNSFYICRNNKPVKYPCRPAEIWDVNSQRCVESDDPEYCLQKN